MTKDRQNAGSVRLHARQLNDALLSVADLRGEIRFSTATIYRKVADGTFPQPIKFGKRCTRWRASDIAAWMAALEEVA